MTDISDERLAALIERLYDGKSPNSDYVLLALYELQRCRAGAGKPVAWCLPLGEHGLIRWGNRRPDEGKLEDWLPLYAYPPAAPDADRRDAERYRWLRENISDMTGPRFNWNWQDEHRPHPPMLDLDTAIDAARAVHEQLDRNMQS